METSVVNGRDLMGDQEDKGMIERLKNELEIINNDFMKVCMCISHFPLITIIVIITIIKLINNNEIKSTLMLLLLLFRQMKRGPKQLNMD